VDYRHYPLDKPDQNGRILHPNAGTEAQALECANFLGGNDKFWAFEKRLYEVTPSVTALTPKGLDPKELPKIAKYVGLEEAAFSDCLSSDQFKNKVESDFTDGVDAGISGTPYSVVFTPSGSKIPIEGAQPYETVKKVLDTLLTK